MPKNIIETATRKENKHRQAHLTVSIFCLDSYCTPRTSKRLQNVAAARRTFLMRENGEGNFYNRRNSNCHTSSECLPGVHYEVKFEFSKTFVVKYNSSCILNTGCAIVNFYKVPVPYLLLCVQKSTLTQDTSCGESNDAPALSNTRTVCKGTSLKSVH